MIELLGIGRHDRLQTLLSSYVDDQVSPAEAARVESHLSGCEECQRDLDNMRTTVGLLRAMPDLQPSRSFYLTAEPEPVRRNWAVQWGGALATAAAAAVFITLIAGDMTGLFEQTGLDVRNEAASETIDSAERGDEGLLRYVFRSGPVPQDSGGEVEYVRLVALGNLIECGKVSALAPFNQLRFIRLHGPPESPAASSSRSKPTSPSAVGSSSLHDV